MMKRKPCCKVLFQTILLIIILLNRVIKNLAKITNFIHNSYDSAAGLGGKNTWNGSKGVAGSGSSWIAVSCFGNLKNGLKIHTQQPGTHISAIQRAHRVH